MIKFYFSNSIGDLNKTFVNREEIDEDRFHWYFDNYNYKYYCSFDHISCLFFIKTNNDECNNPFWLMVEVIS